MNTIKLPRFDPKPVALLHTLHSIQSRNLEIKDLEKHLDHLENTAKHTSSERRLEYQMQLNNLHESVDMLSKYNAEVTIWSATPIQVGDTILIEFYNKRFIVEHVWHVADHKGRFKNPDHAIDTFYVLYGSIGFINAPAPSPGEKESKAKK